MSFLALARERNLPIDPALAEKVERANAGLAIAVRSLGSFARGLVAGEAEDVPGLAGTAVGGLFVLGDVRDALREGTRLASGRGGDELVLGFACVGLAGEAGGRGAGGGGAPARVGLTVVKAARKTGRLGGAMAAWISRSLREVVDWTALKRAINSASIAEPAAAMRGAREAVRIEKAQELVRLVGDVGRVQARAGTRAALDGLKLAEGSRDMSKIARLAAAKGGKTRAILKLAGRSAIVLTVGTFNLATWLFWAIVTLFSFVSSLKRMTERITERYCVRRKLRRVRLVLCAGRPDPISGDRGLASSQRFLPWGRERALRSVKMQRFQHDRVEIAFLDEGEGDPIVLVHGFASTAEVNWVYPGWVATLTKAGRRVLALDNGGHGASSKLYDPAAYHSARMAEDLRALLDHLDLARADVMGYSMGARITAFFALAYPARLRRAVFGGLGIHLVDGVGLPESIAQALEAPSLADVSDSVGRTFRTFAEQTKSDLEALA